MRVSTSFGSTMTEASRDTEPHATLTTAAVDEPCHLPIRVRALYAVPTYAGRCREAGVHGTTVRVDLLSGVVHTLDAQLGVLQRDGGLGADGAAEVRPMCGTRTSAPALALAMSASWSVSNTYGAGLRGEQ
jgi:hypothetical protein